MKTEIICGVEHYRLGNFRVSVQSACSGKKASIEEASAILEEYLVDGSDYGHSICKMG